MEDGVPGIRSIVAEIKPPDTPPTYTAVIRLIAKSGSRPKVRGMMIATATLEDRPGIDPKIIPYATPADITSSVNGLKTFSSSSMIPPLYQNIRPVGSIMRKTLPNR